VCGEDVDTIQAERYGQSAARRPVKESRPFETEADCKRLSRNGRPGCHFLEANRKEKRAVSPSLGKFV